MKPIVALLAVLSLILALSASPALAAPAYEGSISASQPTFAWTGGPISGGNFIGEPCGPSRQCEDTLLHVGDGGTVKIHWKASGPGDQGWMNVEVFKSDAEGNPEGDAVMGGGAFDNEGSVSGRLEAGDYVVQFSALLSVAATYDADATLDTAPDPLAGPSGPKPEDASEPDWYKKAGAEWFQAYIDEEDGTRLHADVLRPEGIPADKPTPVILSIGPYFNHSGQTGPAGPAEETAYTPFSSPGPSNRFADFVLGADVVRKGYTFVMVDLRGFGGSSGCLDWGGPGEQADVVAAIEWAASQQWSDGNVGTYGKSYDGVTGLIAEVLSPKGLKAVVAQEPVYDMYRYLYSEGMRYLNSLATPALYDAIEVTPGSVQDDPEYNVNGADGTARPGCEAGNWADQQDSDHSSDYWRARDLIAKAGDGHTPLFMTQGFLENNTKPDGTWDFFNAVRAPKRAWFGMWDHVRGNDVDTGGRLKMGRPGWFDEVMRFYDQHLRGVEPSVKDPALVVQTSDGSFRGEEQWPPADQQTVTVLLNSGEYTDDTQTKGSGDGLGKGETGNGAWTISPPLPHDAHLAGVPHISLDLETSAPDVNLAAAVYDIDADGQATLVSRQGRLVPESGTYAFDLYGNDWKIPAGHRLGVQISTAHSEWWLPARPTFSTVTVKGGSLTLPFLTNRRTERIEGGRALRLEAWLSGAPFGLAQEVIDAATSASFPLPAPLIDPPAGAPAPAVEPPAVAPSGVAQSLARQVRRRARLTARLRRVRGRRLVVVTGRAPTGTRVTVKLTRAGRTVARRTVRARSGIYRAVFRVRAAGRYRAVVSARIAGRRTLARANTLRVGARA
ncbi:MAG TPA: CocE/NonD family hydrolase [Solirubrobacteraceae bacterium]|jgi:hypothetical protein